MQTNYLQKLLSEQGDVFKRDACGLWVNGLLMSNQERYIILVKDADGCLYRKDVFSLKELDEMLKDFPDAVFIYLKWGAGWSLEISEDKRASFAKYLEGAEDVDLPF